MTKFVQLLGHKTIQWVRKMGEAGILLYGTLIRNPRIIKLFPLLINEIYFIGVLSLIIIVVSGLFIGMVIGLQGYNTLNKFGATVQLGQFVTAALISWRAPARAVAHSPEYQ